MEPETRFCTSGDGVRIAYGTLGAGPPLVFLIGLGDPDFQWRHPRIRAFFERLAAGRTLVWIVPRGFGASGRAEDVSLEAQVADLDAVLRTLAVDRADFMTNGDGASPCLTLAAAQPHRVRRLALWHPTIAGDYLDSRTLEGLVTLARTNWRMLTRTMGTWRPSRGDRRSPARQSWACAKAAAYLGGTCHGSGWPMGEVNSDGQIDVDPGASGSHNHAVDYPPGA